MNEESKPDEESRPDEPNPNGPKPTADSEPTLRVDEDWKEQVAKEKAAAESDENSEPESGDSADVVADPDTSSEGRSPDGSYPDGPSPDSPTPEGSPPQLPPASFEFLVSMLFTQAMSFLGQIPNPESGETRVDKPMAKHSIDTLDLLTEKTRGNLTDDESRMLADALHALRMTYVNARNTSD